eukprot:m.78078 g.78078  ORF g.78078 m.78078 type:complete len:453 (+) comp14572_c0_seq2:1245-2603(+)
MAAPLISAPLSTPKTTEEVVQRLVEIFSEDVHEYDGGQATPATTPAAAAATTGTTPAAAATTATPAAAATTGTAPATPNTTPIRDDEVWARLGWTEMLPVSRDKKQQQPDHQPYQQPDRQQQQQSVRRQLLASVAPAGRGSPLFLAIDQGCVPAVAWLVQEGGMSVTAVDNAGRSPLMRAARRNLVPVMEWLHEHKCEQRLDCSVDTTRDDYGCTALMLAATSGGLAAVQWLSERGASATAMDNVGRTAVHMAAQQGHLEVVQWFLRPTGLGGGGAHPNAEDKNNTSLIHLAAKSRQMPTVQWLALEGGADVNTVDNLGNSVLDSVIQQGDLDAVQWLVQVAGASVEGPPNGRASPLRTAIRHKCQHISEWLVFTGHADVDAQNTSDQRTALMVAASMSDRTTVKWLLSECYADPTLIDMFHRTAADNTYDPVIKHQLQQAIKEARDAMPPK